MPASKHHLCAALGALAGAAGMLSSPPGATAAPAAALERAGVREIVVRRVSGLDARERTALRASVDGRRVAALRLARTEVLRVPAGELSAALAELSARDDVVYAEPNAPVFAHTDDDLWDYQWGLDNAGQGIGPITPGTVDADVDAPEAWALSTGDAVTVAVVDSGVDGGHPDLEGQIAGNPGESGSARASNGADDDGNGLVDDWRGWDFVADAYDGDADPGPDNLPEDPEGHGTHVLGTVVAARDNAEGIAGAAPGARAIPLRALGADGAGELADIADAFDYAGDLGVPVVNASLGGPHPSITLRAAIEAHPQTLYVVAAGNGGDDGVGDDVDVSPEYPCAIPAANVLCVGASDNLDRPAGFSNFGRTSVDLFAPGVDIASTSPRLDPDCDWYCLSSGTSMAAPHAAAVAALVVARHPGVRGAALRQALLDGADRSPAFGASATGGRLNALGALTAAVAAPPAPAGTSQPPSPSPASTASPAAPPAPSSPSAPAPPVATPLRIDGARLTSAVLRRAGTVTLALRTSRPATVTVALLRASSRNPSATLRSATASTQARFRLRRRLGARTLAQGRYRVQVTARAGRVRASRTLALRVR